MSIVLSQRRTGNSVDVFWRGNAARQASLTYRLIDTGADPLLCLRPDQNADLLTDDESTARPSSAGVSDQLILRLADLPRALPGLLPQRERRHAFIAAFRASLEDWPVNGEATLAARLRAACVAAIARLPDAPARAPSRPRGARLRSAIEVDEESPEALFRALYYCRDKVQDDA